MLICEYLKVLYAVTLNYFIERAKILNIKVYHYKEYLICQCSL